MNTFSFVFGGMLGILAAWAFFSASMKLHLAHERLEKLKKIERGNYSALMSFRGRRPRNPSYAA